VGRDLRDQFVEKGGKRWASSPAVLLSICERGASQSQRAQGHRKPLPEGLIREFAAGVDTLYVVEELDPILRTRVGDGPGVTERRAAPLRRVFQSLLRETLLGEKPESCPLEECAGASAGDVSGMPARGLFMYSVS
jgi:indolepyruvate ferredoxin oxidoreductase alpha subunit